MEEAKMRRTQTKGVLTRHSNTLKRYLKERDIPGVQERLATLKLTFDKLETYHYAYCDMLEEDASIAKCEKWFTDVSTEYLALVDDANIWLSDHDVKTVLNPAEIKASVEEPVGESSLSAELACLLGMPKVEIPTFSGDPKEYKAFITIFDDVVANNIPDNKAKLTRLLQYLSGEALAAVRSSILLGASAGYVDAREELDRRFGNTHVITQSIVHDLKTGKPASKPKELRQLANDLTLAHRTLKPLGAYGEINTQQFIRDVLERCPPQIRSRWRKNALDNIGSKGVYPDFEYFCKFMTTEAVRACDPLYGFDVYKAKGTACNVVTSASRVPDQAQEIFCCACSGKHGLLSCGKFKSMDPSQRFQVVKSNRLCFACLAGKHVANKCTKGVTCTVTGCGRKHHQLLHMNQARGATVGDLGAALPPSATSGNSSRTEVKAAASVCHVSGSSVYLPIVPVIVQGVKTYALLDTGSTNTLVSRKLVDDLHLKGESVTCTVDTVGASSTWDTKLVSLSVSVVEGSEQFPIRNAFVVPDIPAKMPAAQVDVSRYSHLCDLVFGTPCRDSNVELLIGLDHPELLVPLEVRCNEAEASWPYATRTRLGWALHGPIGDVGVSLMVNHVKLVNIERQVQNMWNLERSDEELTSESVEDKRVSDLWDREVRFSDGHYELPIPWKSGVPNMPNNRYLAVRRLESTVKRLNKTGMYEAYDANVTKMLDDGHAEIVPQSELKGKEGKVWYLPHHAVTSDAKPGKLRIVFDCAASYQGVSLNNQCHQSPDLVNKLLHVLLRFRLYEVALMADIQAMYLQVRIPAYDRDCLRFLWYRGNDLVEYRMTSHLFGGVWCASSSTFALRCVVNDIPCSELVKQTIEKAMYVDDMLKSVPSTDEGRAALGDVKSVLLHGGFNLTKFVINVPELMALIPEEDRAQETKMIIPHMYSKALGLQWNVSDDQFVYHKIVEYEGTCTKRSMLSNVSSLYDPLGLVLPVIIVGRLLFQRATRQQCDWDAPVSPDLVLEWQAWIQSLLELPVLRFPRCLLQTSCLDGALELHHYCDSSQKAYGACSYLRVLSPYGEVRSTLVMAKGRVAPLHSVTIPRLELCAAVTAVRQDLILRRELGLHLLPSVFWTDSQIVLAYIRSESHRFKVFVANRVAFIRENTDVKQWCFIPSHSNPADLLSRGCRPKEITDMWIFGPDYLRTHRDSWPDYDAKPGVLHADPEVIPVKTTGIVQHFTLVPESHPYCKMIEHYGSYYRLKKAVCWLLRLLYHLRNHKTSPSGRVGVITVGELQKAERSLLRYAQESEYSNEMECLSVGKQVKKTSSIISLAPELKDGLLVVGGRLKHSPLDPSTCHPIILPPKHILTRLILQDFHGETHLGTEWLVCQVRQKFWVPRIRSILRGIKSKCVPCKKLYGSPMYQKMADLPVDRCSPASGAFNDVGVDLFGPFYVKQGRSTVKRYGCIFTCLSSRAVHLEVLNSLESDAFINGFVRFCSRRGYPALVRCDNGTNLVGARAELASALRGLDRARVVRAARRHDIEWIFNPPHASHFGGVWERMIRTVRRVLMAVLNPKLTVTDEVLITIFCEVESIVNSRPLTRLSESVMDLDPLTPNHLLLMKSNYSWAWTNATGGELYRRRWKHVQSLVTMFWRRWLKEYIPGLQQRSKWLAERDDLKVGDLVLLVDEQSPRGLWPLGLVQEAHLGRDGHVRSVRLKTRLTTLVRPITKVVLLEAC